MSGLDSALGPTLEQARAAYGMGYLWWALYVGRQGVPNIPAAYHQWSRAESDVLVQAGFELALPIFFPRCTPTITIRHDAIPEDDADIGIYATGVLGWEGVLALDTEEEMRGDAAWTREYIVRWSRHVASRGWKPVVYAGGLRTVFDWPPELNGVAYPWWIIPGGRHAPPGQAWQVGRDTIAGLEVDIDTAGSGFPLATRAA